MKGDKVKISAVTPNAVRNDRDDRCETGASTRLLRFLSAAIGHNGPNRGATHLFAASGCLQVYSPGSTPDSRPGGGLFPRLRSRGRHLFFFMALLTPLLAISVFTSPAPAAQPQVGRIRFEPELPQTGDNLQVTVGLAGGAVRAEVKWFVNEAEVQDSNIDRFTKSAELNHPIKSGDTIKVEAVAYDEMGNSGGRSNRTVVCQNAPPQLRLVRQDLDGEAYVASVEAEDPEGGAVTFTLRQGPPGMTIDNGGQVRWDMPKGASGSFKVRIAAKDAEGGEAILAYTFTVRR